MQDIQFLIFVLWEDCWQTKASNFQPCTIRKELVNYQCVFRFFHELDIQRVCWSRYHGFFINTLLFSRELQKGINQQAFHYSTLIYGSRYMIFQFSLWQNIWKWVLETLLENMWNLTLQIFMAIGMPYAWGVSIDVL